MQVVFLSSRRYSERLKVGNFNRDSGTLAIRSKQGQIRHVMLTDEVKQSLARWTENLSSADRVFLRADGNHWGASHQMRRADLPVLNQL